MAVINDPTDLSRQQVIYGSERQMTSIRDVGSLVHASLNDVSDGATTTPTVKESGTDGTIDGSPTATLTFTSATADFVTAAVAQGDVLRITTDSGAEGEYVVDSVSDLNTLVVTAQNDFIAWTADYASLTYDVVGAQLTLTSAGSTFQTWNVAQGDVLCIFTGTDAGHYVVNTIPSETTLTVYQSSPDFASFRGGTGLYFDVRDPTGGTTTDGVTEQAIYSYAKEEWKTDSRSATLGDDLFKHPFPLEAITREQMEVGGGTAHDNWTWFNEYTRKKIRTGGWAQKNAASTTLREYTGIVSLGSLDIDAQPYYQQNSATATPTNFTFQGPVNEPIFIWSTGDDRRSYLKLFVRKKARTYAQAEISDIGVTTVETIVNRFPLAHVEDAAISAADAQILGTSTWRGQGASLEAQADGAIDGTPTATRVFTSALADFVTAGVAAGDTLYISTAGGAQGYYTVESVDDLNTLTLAADADFTEWTADYSSLSYTVTSTVMLTGTDGALADVGGTTGTLTSATGGFAGVVAANDMVLITEAGSNHRGVYKVVSQDSDTALTLNTSDRAFTAQSNIDFTVVEPGMYLEYKEESITLSSTGNLTFANADPDTIQRATGSWVTDGVSAGSVVTISGSTSNDGSYTVASITTTSTANDTLVLVATDTLTAEGPVGATATAYDAFKRSIAGVTYAFHWRLFGLDTTLANHYEFVQHQLRQTTDIDWGPGIARGDITDLLMAYAAPTGTTYDMYIDDVVASDTNNVTYTDATGASRLEAYVAAGTISFNAFLQNDASAEYTMYFTNDDAGDNLGYDFGTPNAIIVKDATNTDIAGSVGGSPSISYTYDYDGNVQRGTGSDGVDAPVTIVAIGLSTAQYVILQGTIERSKTNNFSLVAALERNYSNP